MAEHIVDGETPVLFRQLRVEHDLQQQVPQFLGHVIGIVSGDRFPKLGCLLEEVGEE